MAFAAGLWVSALYVRYRDVGHILPMFIQLWMFVSPILYPVSKVPESWRTIYALNPVVSVVEGFRWALIPGFEVDFSMFLPSLIIVAAALVGGLIYFVPWNAPCGCDLNGSVAIRAGVVKHLPAGCRSVQHNTLRDQVMHRLRSLVQWETANPEWPHSGR